MISVEQYVVEESAKSYNEVSHDDSVNFEFVTNDLIYITALNKLGEDYCGYTKPREFFDDKLTEYCEKVRNEFGGFENILANVE